MRTGSVLIDGPDGNYKNEKREKDVDGIAGNIRRFVLNDGPAKANSFQDKDGSK